MDKCPNCNNSIQDKTIFNCPNCGISFFESLSTKLNQLSKDIQNYDAKKNGIKLEIKSLVWKDIKKWIGIISVILGTIFGIGLWQIYRGVTNISIKIIMEKFSEPSIKSTFREVAETQAKEMINNEIIPERIKMQEEMKKQLTLFTSNLEEAKTKFSVEYNNLHTEIAAIKEKITTFESYLTDSKTRFSKEYDTLATEVAFLKERNNLMKLADEAIMKGERKSLNELKNYADNSKNGDLFPAAISEILRIKSFYASTTRIKGVDLHYNSLLGAKYTNEKIPTNILISYLENKPDWATRAKAAQLLSNRKEKGVPETLLKAICQDTRLDVIKIALDSFESITGYKSSDVFNCELAQKWWSENKEEVYKNLKEQGAQ